MMDMVVYIIVFNVMKFFHAVGIDECYKLEISVINNLTCCNNGSGCKPQNVEGKQNDLKEY